ncbi:MAG: prolipoprotein diacylglyceryl transferase [Pseudomonadota bacterium]
MLALPFPNIDPAIFEIDLFGFQFALRWYAMAYLVGLVLGWRYVVTLVRRTRLWPSGRPPMTAEEPEALLTWMVVGVVLGGRLGFAAFYQPTYYLANPGEILAIWQGGMSFHGGFLGVVLGVIGWSWRNRRPVLQVGDAVACAAPIGLLLGRIANFINGELWGRETSLPWGVVFPGEAAGGVPRHPSQLYEALLEGALLFVVMWWLATRSGWLKTPGALIGVFLIGYGGGRSLVEMVRQPDRFLASPDNPLGLAVQWGTTAGLTTGQLLSLPMLVLGLVAVLRTRA